MTRPGGPDEVIETYRTGDGLRFLWMCSICGAENDCALDEPTPWYCEDCGRIDRDVELAVDDLLDALDR